MSESPPSLPAVVGGTPQLNFDALNVRLGVLEGKVLSGSGSPEGVVAAKIGTLFLRSDGGAETTLYVKESGVGNTGWSAK